MLKEEIETKAYISTKVTEAAPAICTGDRVYEEGYGIRYQDGYESFSPKTAFEEAYCPIDGMNFGLVIEATKKGKKYRQVGWSGKSQHTELAPAISYTFPGRTIVNTNHEVIDSKTITFCGTFGVQMGWLAGQVDTLADDWEIVEQRERRIIGITTVIGAAVAPMATVITTVVTPYIRNRVMAQRQAGINTRAKIVVTAAEQIYRGNRRGKEKRAYVLNWLAEHGIALDEDRINALIEVAICELNYGILKGGASNE